MTGSRGLPRWTAPVMWLFAALAALGQITYVLGYDTVGADYLPLRHAASALMHGTSVYADPDFVYPPSAAVAFLPLLLGTTKAMYWMWVALSIGCVVASAVFAARRDHDSVWLSAGVIAFLCLISNVLTNSLFLGNVTLILAPVLVWVIADFSQERWRRGCLILAASCLIKPLLAPLVLVPLVRKRWPDLTVAGLCLVVVEAVAIMAVPGGHDIGLIARRVLAGTNLHRINAEFNLSVSGFAEVHHLSAAPVARVAIVLIVAAMLVAWSRSSDRAAAAAAVCGTTFVGVLLAGPISEVHYLVLVLPVAWMAGRASRPGAHLWPFIVAAVLVCVPRSYLETIVKPGAQLQSWYLAAELLLFAGFSLSVVRAAKRAPAHTVGVGS